MTGRNHNGTPFHTTKNRAAPALKIPFVRYKARPPMHCHESGNDFLNCLFFLRTQKRACNAPPCATRIRQERFGKLTWPVFPVPRSSLMIGLFRASDVATGRKRRAFQCGADVDAPAVSSMVNGEPHIAIAAGANTQPEFKRGNSVRVFALP